MVSRQNADIADTLHLRDVAMATIFWLSTYGYAHWRHMANTTETSMCGGDAALCQITFTTCYYYCKSPANQKCFPISTLQAYRCCKRTLNYI